MSKTPLKILLLPVLVLVAVLAPPAARAQLQLITATINITNQAGTTNGQTLVVNGDTRTWTNSVINPLNQILTNNSIAGCSSNLYIQVADSPFSKLTITQNGTNGIILQGQPGLAISATLSAGWGTITFLTNLLTQAYFVRVPIGIEVAGQQTNIASFLILALDLSTNSLSGTDVALSNYVSMISSQTVIGPKLFTNALGIWGGVVSNTPGLYGIMSKLTNGFWINGVLYAPTLTNGINYGNAFSSPGSALESEQFGAGAVASGVAATAVGNLAGATAANATAAGFNSVASGTASTAVGLIAQATAANSTAVGTVSSANGPGSTAVGVNSVANYTNSTAVGFAATTTAAYQLMLGSAGINVVVNNALNVGGGATIADGVTNLLLTGTNTLPAGTDLSFGRYSLSTLANGNNAGVGVGTNLFVELSGPTGAFTINGLNGEPNRDGKLLVLLNRTGFNLTLAHDSGVEPTSANRLYCLTAADKTVTGNSSALLIYSAAAAHWIVLSFTQ